MISRVSQEKIKLAYLEEIALQEVSDRTLAICRAAKPMAQPAGHAPRQRGKSAMVRPNENKSKVIRLLIFAFLLLGPAAALLYYGWTDRVSDKAMLDHGVETKAIITNAVIKYGKHDVRDYLIDFSWRDAAKQERAMKSASVSGEVWNRLVSGNKLVVNEIPIKYLESDTEPHAILVWDEDYALRLDFFMLCGGVALALLGGAILVMGVRSRPTARSRQARA